jgi:hypothetical protein
MFKLNLSQSGVFKTIFKGYLRKSKDLDPDPDKANNPETSSQPCLQALSTSAK